MEEERERLLRRHTWTFDWTGLASSFTTFPRDSAGAKSTNTGSPPKCDLGIRPTYIRIAEVTGRGYLLSEVESAYRRYVPSQATAPADQNKSP